MHPAGAPKHVSSTYTSPRPLAPPATTFVAPDPKAINSSPKLIQGELPVTAAPSVAAEIRDVVGTQPADAPLQVSRRKTQISLQIEVLGSMSVAWESNATKRPSLLTDESRLWPFVGEPS
jgi:hypothetical protein